MEIKKLKALTLVEMVVYVSLLTIVTTAILDLFLAETNAWGHTRAIRNVNDGGKLVMERLLQEIRLAKSANIVGDRVILDTYLSPTSADSSVLEISLIGEELTIKRDSEAPISLSGSLVRITDIDFVSISSGTSEIVRIEFTAESSQGKFRKEKTFTSATMLKGGGY